MSYSETPPGPSEDANDASWGIDSSAPVSITDLYASLLEKEENKKLVSGLFLDCEDQDKFECDLIQLLERSGDAQGEDGVDICSEILKIGKNFRLERVVDKMISVAGDAKNPARVGALMALFRT